MGLLNLFNDDPVGLDSNGGLALLDLHGTVVLTATLLLLPLAYLTLTLPSNGITRNMLDTIIIPNIHDNKETTSDSGWRIKNVWRQLANLDQTHAEIYVIILEILSISRVNN